MYYFLFAILFLGFFLLVRNEWVYKFRIGVIQTDINAAMKMVNYHVMMVRFWCWDKNPESWFR